MSFVWSQQTYIDDSQYEPFRFHHVDQSGARNALRVLDHIGGFRDAWAMARAAKAVYKLRTSGRLENAYTTTDGTPPVLWPQGWRFKGWSGYGLRSQALGRTEYTGARIDDGRIAAAWLTRDHPRAAMISFRGTGPTNEWATDLNVSQVPFIVHRDHVASGAGVGPSRTLGTTHAGFFHHLNATLFGHDCISGSMAHNLYDFRPRCVYITGHSLGGASAHLAALALRWYFHLKQPSFVPEIKVLTFAAPRVCCASSRSAYQHALFAAFEQASINGLRIVNTLDAVPNIPGQGFGATRMTAAGPIGMAGRFGVVGSVAAGAVIAPITAGVGAIVDAFEALTVVRGRWSHPPFKKLRFTDTGRILSTHPHSMDLYQHVLLDQIHRLERDAMDTLAGRF